MQDELIRKIQHVLDRPITSEMQVVYLLVELRKLMDRDGYQDPILRTFSNWIVHTSLENRADGSTSILSEFDNFIAEIYEHKKLLSHPEHISFGTFRQALGRCFKRFSVSAKFLHDLNQWKKFSRLYCLIVSECPIVFTASKTNLKYIKKVELQGIGRGVVVKKWPVVHWRLTFRDGTTQDWGFHMG
jgi:hypothetical protein